jgi:hypothetical protein
MLVSGKDVEDARKQGVKWVFSGGACNEINEQGVSVRNTDRDGINQDLNASEIKFIDPQIHLETHGEEYTYSKHGPLEKEGLRLADEVQLQFKKSTAGAITALEVVRHQFQSWGSELSILVKDFDDEDESYLPFVPRGVFGFNTSERAMIAHYEAYQKAALQMRTEMLVMLEEDGILRTDNNPQGNVIVHFSDEIGEVKQVSAAEGLPVITLDGNAAHFAEIFSLFKLAYQGRKFILRLDGEKIKNVPTLKLPPCPLLVAGQAPFERKMAVAQTQAWIERYRDEVNELRKKLFEFIKERKLSVVSTDEAAILKLKTKEPVRDVSPAAD